MVTPLKIQLAVIKAYYSMALKSIKYYAGLTVGNKNDCLFKEIRLLRSYVEILKSFTIVGSTIECSCCIEGDYTVLLNDLSEATEANIQFSCNNEGYLVFNDNSYPFTYIYDPSNNTLKISFIDINDNPININLLDIQFTSECNITNTNDLITPNAGSQLEVAIVTVTGTPITVENQYGNWSGTLELIDDLSNPIYTLTIPASILSDPQAIVDLWNTTYGNTSWLLYYNGTSYVMTTPLEYNSLYTSYSVVFTQYEGPTNDSDAEFPVFSVMGFEFPAVQTNTPASAIVEIPTNQFTTGNQGVVTLTLGANIFNPNLGGNIQVIDQTNGVIYFQNVSSFNTLQDFVDSFNAINTIGLVADVIFTNIVRFKTPTNTSSFNGTTFTINYYGNGSTFNGTWGFGIDPTQGPLSITDTFSLNYFKNGVLGFDSVQDFVDNFNLNDNSNVGYSAQITGTSGSNTLVTFTAPSTTGWEYNTTNLNYTLFSQGYVYDSTYSGGIDTTVGTLTINLLDSSNNFVSQLYQDAFPQNYTTVNELFGRLNTSPNNMDFYYTFSFSGNIFNSPVDSFAYYEGYKIEIIYNYESEQYGDVNIVRTLDDGVDPTQQPYEAFFQVDGNTGTFVNDNPCEATIAEQQCLSNKQVSDIIKHIDKLVK